MKQILALLTICIVVGASACKKDYTCACTGDNIDAVIQTIDGKKEAEAQQICDELTNIYSPMGGSCSLNERY